MSGINNNNTMSILLIATAAVVIGGLAVTVSQQAAFADPGGQPNVTYCHIPPGNPANRHEVTAGEPSVQAHIRNHGDGIGPCQPVDPGPT